MQFEIGYALRIFREQSLFRILKKSSHYLRFPFYLKQIRKLRPDAGLEDLVDFAFTVCGGLIKPLQVKKEILDLLTVLDKEKPKIIMEIGTFVGGNLFLFSQIAAPDAAIISVDLPGGMFGGGYPRWRIPLFKLFLREKQKLFLVRADSHDSQTKKKVDSILGDRKIDFLFIDGDHTYKGVKQDFEVFSPLVEKNGLIAFHDIVSAKEPSECGVDRLWSEISSDYDHCNFIGDNQQGWAGIGLIRQR